MNQKQLSICVVEDNMPNRKLFVTLLKRNGFEVSDFGDGNSAIEWLKTSTPDCMLLDILLPDMNGYEILQFVRKTDKLKDLTVIAVTGFGQLNDGDKFIQQGFNGFIAKPVNTGSFVNEVVRIYNESE